MDFGCRRTFADWTIPRLRELPFPIGPYRLIGLGKHSETQKRRDPEHVSTGDDPIVFEGAPPPTVEAPNGNSCSGRYDNRCIVRRAPMDNAVVFSA